MKVEIHKRTNHRRSRWVLDWTRNDGQRQRRFFPTKSAAETEAQSLTLQRQQTGDVWLALTADKRNEVLTVLVEVEKRGVSLRRVWEDWRTGAGSTDLVAKKLGEAVEECLTLKRTAGRRHGYLQTLGILLRAFAAGRESVLVSDVRTSDIENWIAARHTSLWSRATAHNRLTTLFGFCVRRGYAASNPCDRLEKVSIDMRPPAILTVRQSAKVLVFMKRTNPRGLAWFALALMAGIRPEECDRIRWQDVDLDRGIVTVDAAASKVRQRRIVHLQPAAVAWLQLSKKLDAQLPLHPTSRRRFPRQVRDKLGFEAWPKDVLRHTCASYLMASWQDAPRVAAELGNSVDILMRHYRELVRRDDAERFWRLLPRLNRHPRVNPTSRAD